MGASDSIFPHAQRSQSSMDDDDEGNESQYDFIGYNNSTVTWSNGDLVFPRDSFDDIPQVRDAGDINDDDTHIISDQSFIEREGEIAEQSVLEAGHKPTLSVTEDCPIQGQELSIDEIVDAPGLLDISEMNLKDTSITDHESMNLDSSFEESFIESEGDNEGLEHAESEQRIREWHRKIGPALAEAHQRQHFSIFDIGTTIINKVLNGADTMKKISIDEDPHDLSKNFLSLLILTNQGNIILDCGERNCNEPTDLSNIKVNLLSTKRHEVHIEDDIGASSILALPSNREIIPSKTITAAAVVLSSTVVSSSSQISRVIKTARRNIKATDVQQMVRTLQPIPKTKNSDDDDSGVGSFISQDSIS